MTMYSDSFLKVMGRQDQLTTFKNMASSSTHVLDFNNFVPMPQKLREEVIVELVEDFETSMNNTRYKIPKKFRWSKKNWGSKYNAESASVTLTTTLDFQYISSGGPALQVIKKMSSIFPNLLFRLTFAPGDDPYSVWTYAFRSGSCVESIYRMVTDWENLETEME